MARQHIIGLDKPAAASIRSNADLTPHLQFQAADHEGNRLETVAEVLALIAILRRQEVLTGREVVSVEGAVYQFGKGIRADSTHAAHCLPGHLAFNALPFQTMAEWNPARLHARGIKPLPLASKLRNLCGRTDVVDETVNKTDSALEMMANGRGLKPLLGRVVGEVVHDPRLLPSATWDVARAVAAEALANYRRGATQLCQARIGELAARTGTGATPANDEERKARYGTAVAQVYLRILGSTATPPDALTTAGFNQAVRDVVRES